MKPAREGAARSGQRPDRKAEASAAALRGLNLVHWAVGAFEGFKQRKGVVRFAPMAALWRLEEGDSGLGLGSITVLPTC